MRIPRILFWLIGVPFVVLFGCGGGTSGTGLGDEGTSDTLVQAASGISGTITSAEGEPLAWVTVMELNLGLSTKTNEEGFYLLDSSVGYEPLGLSFEYQGLRSEIRIPSGVLEPGAVTIDVTIDRENLKLDAALFQQGEEKAVFEDSLCGDDCNKDE